MKIGIDARLWNQTGVGRYIRNLALNLQLLDKKNEYVLFVRREDTEDVQEKITNPNWKVVSVNIKWHSLKEQYSFPSILNKENLDLVHFPYFSVPIRYRKPFVVTIHDLIVNHFPTGKASTLPLPLYKLKRIGYNRVIRHAVKNAKKILVPLDTVKMDVLRTFNVSDEKIVVTYEGFDLGNSKSVSERVKKLTGESPYFLTVGNAYPHKNLERMIAGFKDFKSKNMNDARLIMVGKNDYFYKILEKKVNQQNLSSVVFLHDVTDGDLSYLYGHSIALVAPSLMEGFGLPPIEAISSDCLVLAANIPSFREVLGESAVYFDPLDTDSISRKMQQVFEKGKSGYKDLIKESHERLALFSWKEMAEKTLKVYLEAAGSL